MKCLNRIVSEASNREDLTLEEILQKEGETFIVADPSELTEDSLMTLDGMLQGKQHRKGKTKKRTPDDMRPGPRNTMSAAQKKKLQRKSERMEQKWQDHIDRTNSDIELLDEEYARNNEDMLYKSTGISPERAQRARQQWMQRLRDGDF